MLDFTSQQAPLEETSTIRLAAELFKSSWRLNPGRLQTDIPFFDALSPEARFHLTEVAALAERFLAEFKDEPEKLLEYNLGAVLYEAYHKHPASTVPDLPWDTAPHEVQALWINYGRDFMALWVTVRHMPRYFPFMNLTIKKD